MTMQYTTAELLQFAQLNSDHKGNPAITVALKDCAEQLASKDMRLQELTPRIETMQLCIETLQTENAALKLQAANANLHSLQVRPSDLDSHAIAAALSVIGAAANDTAHMAHLCALAHSAVSLMILPPFARDAHKLRADGTLEPQSTKDTP